MKTQYEATSRYERLNEKKLLEQIIELVTLGKARRKAQTVSFLSVALTNFIINRCLII